MAVYIIGCEGSHLVKIGWASDVTKRCATLARWNSHPVFVIWQSDDKYGFLAEQYVHRFYRERQHHGEWFDFGEDDPVPLVERALAVADSPEGLRHRKRRRFAPIPLVDRWYLKQH